MTARSRARLPLAAAVLLALLAPATAAAQVLTAIEFSFSNPGARSMGFGGAFVALADDATAAFANPAGLVQLNRPEISVEGRFWSYSSPYTAGGRAVGEPTGIGIDTVAEPIRVHSQVDLAGLSFVSLVYPKGRWSFAFYRHQLMNFELSERIQGIFTPGPVAGAWRGPIELGHFDFDISSRTLAAAYRINDRLSLGLGIARFEESSMFLGSDYLPDADTLEAYFAPASFLPHRLLLTVRGQLDGSDLGISLGVLARLTPRWMLGGVFREGPRLGFLIDIFAGPAHPEAPAGANIGHLETYWGFPDVYALGLSYRSANGRWTGSLEWSRVEYSTILGLDTRLRAEEERLDDADELHLGGEYAFFRGHSVVALRLGAWHDPDHQPRDESSAFSRAEVPGGSDELHLTAGVGIAFDDFQVDLGIDSSRLRDTASISLIYSF